MPDASAATSGAAADAGSQGSMRLMLLCPNVDCRTPLAVPASSRGKPARCPRCRALFRVPLQGSTVGTWKKAAGSNAT